MKPTRLVTIHQPQYLPYTGLLAKIDAADAYVFFDTADYQKNYFDNRNRVLTKNGVVWLTVPVHALLKTSIKDTKIAGTAWIRKHMQTLQQAYGKAPFFEPYFSELCDVLRSSEFSSLADLAEVTTRWLLTSFGITSSWIKASDLGGDEKKSPKDRLIELVRASGGDGYLAGPSWNNYLTAADVGDFFQSGIAFYSAKISQASYVGHNGFHQNLSALDLLFSCGQAGIDIIRNSITLREVLYEQASFDRRGS